MYAHKLLCFVVAVSFFLVMPMLGPASAGADAALDFDLPDGSGHFYRQAIG